MGGDSRASGDGRAVAVALGFLAVLVPLVFHRAFLSSEAIVYLADAAQLQFPRYTVLCDALQNEHAIPLWQTLVYGGTPFHASPENPTLYPPVLLFAAFASPVLTINLIVLSGLALAALGAYLFTLRLWSRVAPDAMRESAALGPVAAFVAACLFSMLHYTRIDHLNLVAYGHAHAWIPWMLWAAELVLTSERPRRAAGLLALSVAAEFHTGGLYVWPYAFLMLALWFVVHGLFGDRETRKRTVVWGGLAAVCAGAMILAKIVPYLEWVPTTNRSGFLPYDRAVAVTLGGDGDFTWGEVRKRVGVYAAGGWPFLLALGSLPLLKSGRVRSLWVLGAFFFAVACGGPAYRLLYEVVPPFDQIRNAVRAWMMVNALLPVAAGLGAAWVLGSIAPLRSRGGALVAVGIALGLVAAKRAYHSTPRHDEVLHNPDRYEELIGRYVVWPQAAEAAGDEWRAYWIDKREPDGHNEQFVSSSLGVETVAGYVGHVWPAALERHVYFDDEGEPLEAGVRHRRLATQSVRWFVTLDGSVPPTRPPDDFFPPGVDGSRLFENTLARPRAFAPSFAVGVRNSSRWLVYRHLDDARVPLQHVSLIETEDGSTDWVLFGMGPGPHNVSEEQAAEFAAKANEVAAERPSVPLRFTRLGSRRVRVETDQPLDGRFVVVSEPWALYPGWTVTDDTGRDLPIHRADGINSAVFLPEGATSFEAVYAPRSVWIGYLFGLAGLAGALALCFTPRRSSARSGS